MDHQIDQWKGEFGDEYHTRQNDLQIEAQKRVSLWESVLNLLPTDAQEGISIFEIGAGTGANIEAIRNLYESTPLPPIFYALEPNRKATTHLPANMVGGEACNIEAKDKAFDFVFTYGVLIHLEEPLRAMREMYRVSRRFVMCAEYFAPGRERRYYRDNVPIYKGDYGSLLAENFDLKLLGYGFCWRPATGLDNVTWWLFEKS